MLDKRIIYVTGLPRSGSTLLCQLLGHNPNIYSLGYSSPLCQILTALRHEISENEFLLAQLDGDFDLVYKRLTSAFRGFINGWVSETKKLWVVDKNRGWLHHIEVIHALDPKCRMLVCVRELGQIIQSIETQHLKTILLDFPNNLADLCISDRVEELLSETGIIGMPLRSIENLQFIDKQLQERVHFIVFEDLVENPIKVMKETHKWLGIDFAEFDPENLNLLSKESDSYYRFKYPHDTYRNIHAAPKYYVSDSINITLSRQFGWYYNKFYPNAFLPGEVHKESDTVLKTRGSSI